MAMQLDCTCQDKTGVFNVNQQKDTNDTNDDLPIASVASISRKRGWSADIFQYGNTNQTDVWNARHCMHNRDQTHTLAMSAPPVLGDLKQPLSSDGHPNCQDTHGVQDDKHERDTEDTQDVQDVQDVPSVSETDPSSTAPLQSPMASNKSLFTEEEKNAIADFAVAGFVASNKIIAAGKFGQIYAFRSNYVVKSARYFQSDPTFTMREVNILYALRGSKHVVRMLAYKTHTKGVALLLDRYETNLYAVVNRCTYHQALGYAIQLCSAVDEIHSRGVMHRDLHMGNILVRGDMLCLTDFGNSKFVRGYRHTAIVTALPNIAPEQITCPITGRFEYRISVYDQRCDLWALGCVLHELYSAEYKFAFTHDDFMGFYAQLRRFQDFHIDPSTQPALLYATSLLIRRVPRQRIPAKRVAYILREAYTTERSKDQELTKRSRQCEDE